MENKKCFALNWLTVSISLAKSDDCVDETCNLKVCGFLKKEALVLFGQARFVSEPSSEQTIRVNLVLKCGYFLKV